MSSAPTEAGGAARAQQSAGDLPEELRGEFLDVQTSSPQFPKYHGCNLNYS